MKINYFSKQVKYSGRFEEYTPAQLYAMAIEESGLTDCFDRAEEVTEEEVLELDGKFWVDNTYPCNKIATVTWCFAEDDEWDE